MTDKYAELRRLAKAAKNEGEWYDYENIACFPDCAPDEHYVIECNPSTILSLLDELETCRRDAERYHFIANACEVFLYGKEIEDEAELDAAMQEQKP